MAKSLQQLAYESGKGNLFEQYNAGQLSESALRSAISGGGGGGGGYQAPDFAAIARQQMDLQREANQPAVSALQSSIPTTQEAFAQRETQLKSQSEPLNQRYQNLLGEVTRRQGEQTAQTSQNLSREYGKRGIPLSSGAFDVALQENLKPIQEYYTGQTKDIGLAQSEANQELQNLIAGIPIERQQALDQINQSIAQLQAGGSRDAIQSALSLSQMQQQANQFAAQQSLQQRLADLEGRKVEGQFANSDLQRQMLELQLEQARKDLAPSPIGGGITNTFGGGINITEPKPVLNYGMSSDVYSNSRPVNQSQNAARLARAKAYGF